MVIKDWKMAVQDDKGNDDEEIKQKKQQHREAATTGVLYFTDTCKYEHECVDHNSSKECDPSSSREPANIQSNTKR